VKPHRGSGNSPDPILFGIELRTDPPFFEVLFIADKDPDHCVARVTFDRPVKDEQDAFLQARRQLAEMSENELRDLECTAAPIDPGTEKPTPRK
jgi:hypothetical protein